jgi:GT2 family glycosyltransferase/glycosyltransferase involved in cell wall biosynthesis
MAMKPALHHQPNDGSEISAITRWCLSLAIQSKWSELGKVTKDLAKRFPANLTLAELYVIANVNNRNLATLADYYRRHPEMRTASPKLAASLFDFLALTGNYDDLIMHVWDCIKVGASDDLISYVDLGLNTIFATDPAFGFALSHLTGDPNLPPLNRIMVSFSDFLSEGKQNIAPDTNFSAQLPIDMDLPTAHRRSWDGTVLDEMISRPEKLVDHLARNRVASHKAASKIDVIIPVFSGYQETMRCIASVLLNPQSQAFSIIVIDDCTPDPEIAQALNTFSRAGLIDLHRNPSNLGFVRSCNYGVSLHPDRDVVLLNSDTEVYGDWIDRILIHAGNYPDAGTITPFSNNATICSYPCFVEDNEIPRDTDGHSLDRIAAIGNRDSALVEIPTGVGFCMYVRRACINEFGLFDYDNFGKGYGEENDFCQKIAKAGYKNYLASNLFVYHAGATSFGDSANQRKYAAMVKLRSLHPSYEQDVADHIQHDPGRVFRQRIDIQRLKMQIASENGATLHITHAIGGGTEKHVQELCNLLKAENRACLIARPHEDRSGRFAISCFDNFTFPNLPTFSCFENSDEFISFLAHIGVKHIHIHHLLGYGHLAPQYFSAIATKIETDFTAHDYFSICPRINLLDGMGQYCGGPSADKCQPCITEYGSNIPHYVTAESWRDSNIHLLSGMRKIFAPSLDCADRIAKHTGHGPITVRPHPVLSTMDTNSRGGHFPSGSATAIRPVRKIAILGAINDVKGARVIAAVASEARNLGLSLHFHVIGHASNSDHLLGLGNVFIYGAYTLEELPSLIAAVDADYLWIPSVWPETFCYTLMEGILSGMMPVCFEIGAQAERVHGIGWGVTLPLNLQDKPRELAMRLNSIVVEICPKFKLEDFNFKGFDRYYELSI